MNNTWYSFSVSDVGKKRTVNQDSIYSNDNQMIWAVADGMGGHRDGDKASQAIIAIFEETTFSQVMSERLIQIEKSIRTLNADLQNYSSNNLNGQLMGSTIIVFTVCQGMCAVLWVGDSRCYKISQNIMKQVSWDHSYVDELLRAGHMVEEEAAASKLSNVITRAVGAHDELFFDHVIMPYSDEDTFLLCSDGLTHELTDVIIEKSIIKNGCAQVSIDDLLTKTLDHGARDNVSIMLISSQQRRPKNTQEARLIESYSGKLNTLANVLFNREIELTSYYQKFSEIIEQSISSHNSFKGQDTQELPVLKREVKIEKKPTVKFPKVTLNETNNRSIDYRYSFLIATIISLFIILMLLVFN
ncbi:MAG: hypothetical protein COB83_09835 [Gammaproteobacteria bacterium]|nr:MAG: hypothetical protein COB83_09835 [Gammaproteobacteria bacterium]